MKNEALSDDAGSPVTEKHSSCVFSPHTPSVWFLFFGSSTPSLLIVFHQIFAFSPGLSSSNWKWRRISTRSIHRNGLSPAEMLKATASKVKRTTRTAYVNMFKGFCKHHNATNRRSTSDGCLSLWKRSFLMWCKMENGSCQLDVQVKYVRMEMTWGTWRTSAVSLLDVTEFFHHFYLYTHFKKSSYITYITYIFLIQHHP